MVLPAIERQIGGDTGAAVMWIESMKRVKEPGGKVPADILVGSPGELILIDHSCAFTTDNKLVHKLERVDAPLWARMKGRSTISRGHRAGGSKPIELPRSSSSATKWPPP